MTRARIALGRQGEDLAAAYLEKKGYRIVGRNERVHRGEIDIVALDGDVLVFVEVRTRRGQAFGTALESVDRMKQARLVQVARAYMARREMGEVPCRFDVVAVSWSPDGASPKIDHIQNAFAS